MIIIEKMAFPKIDGYIVTEKLGSGSYSTVFKAHTKVGARSIVAIKCVDKSRIKNSGSAIDNLITEIRLLKTLTHPHIVHMKNFTWDDKNIYIIMEYCCGGDLSKYIHKYGRVPERQVLYFLQQLASALKFLREQNVVHMDLKPHNLLLHKDNGKYILKVADFGFAQYMTRDSSRSVRGSPLYMAPEMIFGEYDARVDLWSVGVIMYECLFGKAPYSSGTFKDLIDKIQRKAPIEIPPNSSISGGCRDLLMRLLQHDPNNRISYEEFFSHEYLDLEHMPNKENYEKNLESLTLTNLGIAICPAVILTMDLLTLDDILQAVSLIKKAVELDSAGKMQDAFVAYRDSLRYLVPVVHSENDAVRRGALTAKLTRYMERAEELKSLLRGDSRATAARPSRDVTADVTSRCCGTTADGCYNKYTPSPEKKNACNNCSSTNCSCVTKTSESAEKSVSYKAGSDKISSDGRSSTPGSVLRRLFSRHSTLPLLDDKDSSITDESTNGDKKKDKTQNDNPTDACKIT